MSAGMCRGRYSQCGGANPARSESWRLCEACTVVRARLRRKPPTECRTDGCTADRLRSVRTGEPLDWCHDHAPVDPEPPDTRSRQRVQRDLDRASVAAQRVAAERAKAHEAMLRFVSQASMEVVRREEAEEGQRQAEIDRRYYVGVRSAELTLIRPPVVVKRVGT